jgi:hypothetical protein
MENLDFLEAAVVGGPIQQMQEVYGHKVLEEMAAEGTGYLA